MKSNWDKYWLSICKAVAENSKCLSRKIGAVVVRDGKYLVSTGYNGPAKGCLHCSSYTYRFSLYRRFLKDNPVSEGDAPLMDDKEFALSSDCPRRLLGFASGEGLAYCQAAHAERNAISVAAMLGHATDGCTMYMNCPISCMECAKSIVNAGIKEIVVTKDSVYEKTGLTGKQILAGAGVRIREFQTEDVI